MADQQQLVTPQINASCFDLLIIEIVPLALRVINETTANAGAAGAVNDDDVYYKIEQFGFKLGRNLAEIFTRERERFQNQLDVMKFICKELWPLIFKKQIDNLKTNHRGTYVLIDSNFTFCSKMSTNQSAQNTVKQAMPYLWFPMGIIRGTLSALGVEASLSFESNHLPNVSFNIHTTR
ncbi:similar to Saccharomyces cerevisiae YOR115C TRS33 One of 10 subunits of the transport protein particle (TRAPP) complex of the cis-Golgi [Geotrichum candidum]|uniref:Similar to Saccharomyces cerevisiae YOR115C TRS33 One of 10 subunits of the transport protein particle (TRAPP) complex of the cis-Golgi n=1 Tax=Geotrichum candidum TaxID=1173061 RepID=A0A0J9X2F3_GEOCN|nr:similar to Saccharomyces cerevisiae YOR115C TRS33 One of 10 subunits of the transport protein particle (TRAPP) complex of the cis-Golgi [Geotrichum candidum]